MKRHFYEDQGELSEAEREILRCLQKGLTNRQIAARMGSTPGAIASHLHRLYRRLWVPDRKALVAYARGRTQ